MKSFTKKNRILLILFLVLALIGVSTYYLVNTKSVQTFLNKDSCLDSGGRYDEKSSICIFSTNGDGSSPYEKLSGCEVDKVVALDTNISNEMHCRISTISSYSDHNLIVIDKVASNSYYVRILNSIDNQTELYREEVKREFDFQLYFSYFPSDNEKEVLLVLERENPELIGFLHRDSSGYKIIWKS